MAARPPDSADPTALLQLPPLSEDPAGPLGSGLLATGILANVIRHIQADVAAR